MTPDGHGLNDRGCRSDAGAVAASDRSGFLRIGTDRARVHHSLEQWEVAMRPFIIPIAALALAACQAATDRNAALPADATGNVSIFTAEAAALPVSPRNAVFLRAVRDAVPGRDEVRAGVRRRGQAHLARRMRGRLGPSGAGDPGRNRSDHEPRRSLGASRRTGTERSQAARRFPVAYARLRFRG